MSANIKHPVIIFAHLYERGREIFESPKYTGLQFIKSPGRNEKEFLSLVHKHQARAVVLDSKPFTYSSASSSPDKNFFSELLPGSILVRFGSGVDNIPLSHCTRLGHKVVAIPQASTDSVCEYVFTALGILSRKLLVSHRSITNWIRPVGHNLGSGRTMAILGFGNIGKAVALTAVMHHRMQVRVLIRPGTLDEKHDKLQQMVEEFPNLNKHITLSEELPTVLADADYISVHLNLSRESVSIINRKSLNYTKPGALLVNTARGKHLEEADVCRALMDSHLGGAAIDVFPTEPYSNTTESGEPTYHTLSKTHPNLLLTSHIAGNTDEANRYTAETVARNLTDFFKRDFAKLNIASANKE